MCSISVFVVLLVFFFKQKTAYEMRISDWSSDVCSSDLEPKLLETQLSAILRAGAHGPVRILLPMISSVGQDRKSVVEGKSVSVRVDLGGRRIIKKKKK